jgi:uroporphyrinogen-III synthase
MVGSLVNLNPPSTIHHPRSTIHDPIMPSFDGLRVLVLESRRARELASIVTSYGGRPLVAPSMREVPLESNAEAVAFADGLIRGDFDVVVLLTGVGTRALLDVVQRVRGSRDPFVEALRKVRIVARGPKPVAVLRELNIQPSVTAPEPNTWREVLAALDAQTQAESGGSLRGMRVAVQEYGASNPDLLAGLEARGARVTPVPVYQWALPDDLEPLRTAVRAIAAGELDVALFTTATQVVHLLKVAGSVQMEAAVRDGLSRLVIASIGPTTSEELRQQGIAVDMEPSHPKMGFLVREAAERAGALLRGKRGV